MASNYNIKSLLVGRRLPAKAIFPEPAFILLRIADTKEFDQDGKPTGKIIGYTIECVDQVDYQHLNVKVSSLSLPLTEEELQELRSDGKKVLIEFDNLTVMAYLNDRAGALMDSFKADGFQVVSN